MAKKKTPQGKPASGSSPVLDGFRSRVDEYFGINKLMDQASNGASEDKRRAYGDLKSKILSVPGSNVVDPDKMTEKEIFDRAQTLQDRFYKVGANNYFSKNFDGIMTDLKRDKESVLEAIAESDDLVKAGGRDYQKVLVASKGYREARGLVESYKAGQVQDPRKLIPFALEGTKEEKERVRKEMEKNKEYDEEQIDAIVSLIDMGVRDGYIKEAFVDKGADSYLKVAEDEFKKILGKDKKFVDYVTDVFGKMKDAGGSQFEKARDLAYNIAKSE